MEENKDKKIWSVYGGFGFVLGEFCKIFKDEVVRIEKDEVAPQSPHILYGISTTDNYNVFDSHTLDIETNLLRFMDVLDACHKKYGTKFEFILISSWFVYGVPSSTAFPLLETTQPDPKGFYSITARAREQLLVSYCETFGIRYKILRLANVLGSKDKKVSKKKNALQYLIQKIILNETIELYDNGEFFRDYIDVRDCAVAIKSAMESTLPYTTYNISNGVSHKFRGLIEFVIEYSGSKSLVMDKLDVPEFHAVVQSKNVFISNRRLGETGYAPKYSIQDTLMKIVDDYQN